MFSVSIPPALAIVALFVAAVALCGYVLLHGFKILAWSVDRFCQLGVALTERFYSWQARLYLDDFKVDYQGLTPLQTINLAASHQMRQEKKNRYRAKKVTP